MSTAYLFNEADSSFIPVQDGLVLGRTEGHLRFEDDPMVSRSHCQLRIINQELYLEDLASRNRTRVNRVALIPRQPRKIRFNDVIRIGAQRLILTATPTGIPEGNVERTREISTRVDIQKSQAPAQRSFIRSHRAPQSPDGQLKELERFEIQSQLSVVTLAEIGWESKRVQARQSRQFDRGAQRMRPARRGTGGQHGLTLINALFGALVVLLIGILLNF